MKYYKIYHYSPKIINHFPPYDNKTLDFIDPKYYGSGVTQGSECKRGKQGLDKSYFYNKDEPETCVKSGNKTRYEIYLPYEWKAKIFDIGTDNRFYQEAKNQLEKNKPVWQTTIQEHEILELQEKLIKENGYKGWTNTLSVLPHVVVIFEKLSTKKPVGKYIAYDWSDNEIENTVVENIENTSIKKPNSNAFFRSAPVLLPAEVTPIAIRENIQRPNY